ncbi:alpha/beta-hydrolase [Auriscalpium vulgare]|uniref:Alpha/beta-hydrolase n=1 Tax=Auriscalpium vulgare TaxID=40419 RepID=A0ACB8S796_9AGAM|nr:alpha/beta-hydrolase [Auriscalpium vulgare]
MLFPFRHQPFKGLYHIYILISLVIRIPLWTIAAAIPPLRPRRTWSFKRSFLIRVLKLIVHVGMKTDPFFTLVDVAKNASNADELGFVWVDGVPDELVVGEIAAAAKANAVQPVSVPGYWYGQRAVKGRYGQPAAPEEKVLLVLHGGAYVVGTGAPNGAGVPNIVNALLEHCGDTFYRAFAVDYRLSSTTPLPAENPFPAALLDALAAYRYLVVTLGFSPSNIVVEGHSAGGHLAIALARYLVALSDASLGVPGGLLLFSPTGDWAGTHDTDDRTCSLKRNYASDFIDEILKSGFVVRALTGALPADTIYQSAYLSPASLRLPQAKGLFDNFPKTCIVAGGAEQTLDAMLTLRERIEGDVGAQRVRWLMYEDATHDFLGLTWHEPERSQALRDIEQWVATVF